VHSIEEVPRRWFSFWTELQPIYEFFETRHQIPPVLFGTGKYELAVSEL
jgi:hypothetical protein